MANNQQLLLGEGAGGAPAVYIEDVFSTYLYTANNTVITITNGIDLATKGGLVWQKARNGAGYIHCLFDTARGVGNILHTDNTAASDAQSDNAALSTGFTTGRCGGYANSDSLTYASWTFREQPKFFDVVTYTGTGSNTTIAHTLGSVPGCIIVKRTDTTADWAVYHRSLANTQYLVLNTTAAAATGATWWNSTTPTSSVFSIGTDASVNASGGTYVAYIYAHDAGGFGASGTDNVISCGSFTTDGSGNIPAVTLGWEPQYLLVKASNNADVWRIHDTQRGWDVSGQFAMLRANGADAESPTATSWVRPTATGFEQTNSPGFGAGATFIYIAIRRGPMKVPTVGTSVFSPVYRQGTSTVVQVATGFVTDLGITQSTQAGYSTGGAVFYDRLRGRTLFLSPSGSSVEDTYTTLVQGFDTQSGVIMAADTSRAWTNFLGSPPNDNYEFYANWFFKRAPGFFDVVCYTGNGASGRTIAHNLGVAPEMMILKSRSNSGTNYQWFVYHKDIPPTPYATNLVLNGTSAAYAWSEIIKTPTTTTFGINDSFGNLSAATYVAYLFATCAGVSKVGSYTGTGTTLQIDCGFTAGARWVMIKRTDSTGNWFVWDSARGIVAGNDPYLVLNTTAAQVANTDYIDTYNAGFEISSTAPAAINASAGTFIFLAIA